MRIAQMISPVHSLGPGERLCLWTQGCSKRCPACVSPEFQSSDAPQTDEETLSRILIRAADSAGCDGLTISGGDPLEQPQALLKLLKLLRHRFPDILVYTGYTMEQIRAGAAGDAGKECLQYIDVLIDGPYIDERNHPDCVLRGSDNQNIWFLNPTVRERYGEYMKAGRKLESFCHDGTVCITGIFNRREPI